jgi:HTH-type transcriptional regulator/antitoxin HipB
LHPAIFPFGNIFFGGSIVKYPVKSVSDIGAAVRSKRKDDGLTLIDAAGLCNVNYRFLSDLENGKPTVRMDKVLQVLAALGLELEITERSWKND